MMPEAQNVRHDRGLARARRCDAEDQLRSSDALRETLKGISCLDDPVVAVAAESEDQQ